MGVMGVEAVVLLCKRIEMGYGGESFSFLARRLVPHFGKVVEHG